MGCVILESRQAEQTIPCSGPEGCHIRLPPTGGPKHTTSIASLEWSEDSYRGSLSLALGLSIQTTPPCPCCKNIKPWSGTASTLRPKGGGTDTPRNGGLRAAHGACIQDIKAGVRALGGNRFTSRQRKQAGHVTEEAGGCLLSVDLSQAVERVNRAKLDRALAEHDPRSPQSTRRLRTRCAISFIQRIRQGCHLAPALWAILPSQVLWDLTPPGLTPMHLPLTLFADDLGHCLLKSVEDARHMEATMLTLFRILASYSLNKVNPEKSSLIIRVQGTQLSKFVKSRTIIVRQQPHWKLQDGDTEHLIPICESITYLGTKLVLKEGSDKTLEFRLAELLLKCLRYGKAFAHEKVSRDITGSGCGKLAWSVVPCMG